MKRVKCKSGLTGWQSKLHAVYDSYEQFCYFCSAYGIHKRIGYRSIKAAWAANPTIRGSIIPEDLEKIKQ